MKKAQARGYLLEIVLSKLIEINGYDVIRVADNDEIVSKGNGLNVRGRGGFHQFDTLGEFKITPPFVYPLRLFVEAKFYDSNKVGIDRVRMGVGILEDVNTNCSTVEMNEEELSKEKYQYHYAIFSTSGFTEDAQRFAIAHKIHLIDLSGGEYKKIIDLIKQIVDALCSISRGGSDYIPKDIFSSFKENFSDMIINGENNIFTYYIINKYCYIIDNLISIDDLVSIEKLISKLRVTINNRFIYLATINSPHVVPLFSKEEFNEELRRNPHQNMVIVQSQNQPNKWDIISIHNENISITVTLPHLLQRYMLPDLNNIEDTAIHIKENDIRKFVFIAYLDNVNPTLCTLTFDRSLRDK